MAKMSALQQEIAKVEREIDTLRNVKTILESPEGSFKNIDADIDISLKVLDRLRSALPPVKTRSPRKKSEVTGAAAKPNGKGKQATA